MLTGEFRYGSWFEHILQWHKFRKNHPEINIHFVCYEEMKANPVLEISKLCKFLGKDDKIAEDIAYKTSFEQMKSGIKTKRENEEKTWQTSKAKTEEETQQVSILL